MTAYALAHLRRPETLHPGVFEYMKRVQATLDPFGGEFLVHGGQVEVVEGEWPGDLVLIAFPDIERARAWYASPAYQEILPLRTDHLDGDTLLVPGVSPGHQAAELADRLARS
ncbi:DUF1330 domain-containing protein [Saccharothrix sp. AJ9571]|nr:DUF1330 domain-containing protein [Saccharothrix sp. AJ9571]